MPLANSRTLKSLLYLAFSVFFTHIVFEFSPIFHTALILLSIAFWHSKSECKSICSINFYMIWRRGDKNIIFNVLCMLQWGAMGQMEHDPKDNDYATLHFGNILYVSYCVLCIVYCTMQMVCWSLMLLFYSVLVFPFLQPTPHILCSA